ncbi:MAG UNVERIFIED_CONTAM: hypothetical protein LVR18_46905 [Planctomycetaceae bacterium]|jgi:hypothetical protein
MKLSDGSTVSTEVLAIGGTDINAFAGTNAGTPDAIGFNLTGLSFAFATATDVADRTRSWTALDASATAATFNGIPDVTISATALQLSLNRPASDSTLIDFASTKLVVRTGASTTRDLDLSGTAGPLLEASGTFTVDVAGFLNLSGALAVRKSTFDLALSDGTTKAVNLLTVAGENLSAFAGMNASDATNRAGLSLTGLKFGLAVATDKADPDRRWTTLQANAGSISLTGISGVTMSSSDLAVSINRKANDDTLANYSSTPLTLSTGTGQKVLNLSSSSGQMTEATGTINIAVQNFFTVNGTFSVRSSRDTAVTLSNGTTIDADLLTIGGTNVSAFAGLNGGSATQTGINLGSTNFGLALITDRSDATRKFTSLQATAGLASFVGSDSISISGTNLAVAINRGLDNNFPAIPGASANSQYRLTIADQTLGSVTFTKGTSSASANILAADTDAQVAARVKTALESVTGIGSGNVTVSGSRAAGFTIEFINTLAKTNVTGLTVSTNATLSGSLAAVQTAASVSAVSAVQSITLTRTPVDRPTVTTTITEKTAGQLAAGKIAAITISADVKARGSYTLTYNGKTETIRWAQSSVNVNASRLESALRSLTGDTTASARFDQSSLITSQTFIVKFSITPGTISGNASGISGSISFADRRSSKPGINEVQQITLAVGTATGTFQIAVPYNGRTYTTTSLALTASAADVQTAVNTALTPVSGSVSVTKTVTGTDVTYELTYSGDIGGEKS